MAGEVNEGRIYQCIVASFPGQAIEQTRIYVEREEEKEELTDLKAQFAGVEVTTEPFSADITLEDGTTPKMWICILSLERTTQQNRADGTDRIRLL